jgi:hypothetical protein
MSLYGIMNGPNGQPAYYEVRNANKENPVEYGTVINLVSFGQALGI